MSQKYDFEDIWRRIYKRVNLKSLAKARTDKQRFEVFKKSLDDEVALKNLKKFKRENFVKLYRFGIAQVETNLNQRIEKIEKKRVLTAGDRKILKQKEMFDRIKSRSSQKTLRSIAHRKGRIRARDIINEAIAKVEVKKGVKIKVVPEKAGISGREPTIETISKDFTVKQFKSRGNRFVGFWKKGKRGFFSVVRA